MKADPNPNSKGEPNDQEITAQMRSVWEKESLPEISWPKFLQWLSEDRQEGTNGSCLP